jgi:hypothetical protein
MFKGNAVESSSPERESCDSSSRNGSAGDLLDNWDGSRPPVSGREGTPSWRSAASDNETRVKRRPKPKVGSRYSTKFSAHDDLHMLSSHANLCTVRRQ